uniref:Uncharacterized protein n=1 Tax=viral metagenome TaxID=1070528 RepID=A0A6C0DKC6_9ZZZZ
MDLLSVKTPMELNEDKFLHLQNVIKIKRDMLINKQKKIKQLVKQNHFLNDIKNDYIRFNNYTIKQKQDQITALELLKKYIHDLTVSGNLSDNNLKDALYEQNKIKKELRSIKLGLDRLMNETNEMDTNLLHHL